MLRISHFFTKIFDIHVMNLNYRLLVFFQDHSIQAFHLCFWKMFINTLVPVDATSVNLIFSKLKCIKQVIVTYILGMQKLHRLCAYHNLLFRFRATSMDVEEANRTVYLNVSRTNGIDLAVSVEWETVSETAFGMSMFCCIQIYILFVLQIH